MASSVIANVITTNSIDLTGVLNEVLSLLPKVLPVIISFLALRKGIIFLIGSLRRA